MTLEGIDRFILVQIILGQPVHSPPFSVITAPANSRGHPRLKRVRSSHCWVLFTPGGCIGWPGHLPPYGGHSASPRHRGPLVCIPMRRESPLPAPFPWERSCCAVLIGSSPLIPAVAMVSSPNPPITHSRASAFPT